MGIRFRGGRRTTGRRYRQGVEPVNRLLIPDLRTCTVPRMTASRAARRPGLRGRRASRPSGDDRELAILATAERLLARTPLSAISVDDLARGAGISRPTFYFYFGSKDAVLLSLLDRVVAEADAASARAFADPAADRRACWRDGITAYYATFRAHRSVVHASA